MTKTELLEAYTAEQLADMVVKLNNAMDSLKYSDSFLKSGLFDNPAVAACETRINILQNKINNLEEENGRLQFKLDTYNHYLLQKATKETKEMIDHNHFSGVTVVSLEQLDNGIKKESNEPDIRGYEETIDGLQSEVEKYRKALEDAKKERDCQIAEYRKKIEELENRDITELLQAEPIKAAEILITAKGAREPLHIRNDVFKDTYRIFDVSELRQIAEHLLVYCNSQKENVNE